DNGLCGRLVQFTVKRNNTAKCRGRIGLVSALVSRQNGLADGHAARISMLYNDARGLSEFFYALQCCIGIRNVVIRQCFALHLLGGSDRGLLYIFFYIEGGILMAVLAITHILLFNEVKIESTWEASCRLLSFTMVGGNHATEVVGNHAVVRSGVFKRFDCKVKTGFQRQ
ncbi:hypothetical protein NS226_23790, partial [Aureimonas ureilytica]